ncbi:C-C motif chemokine 19-like [Hippoglossus hippoglossus]|uniref:C-C motif chemokine 19-like n=1 Tax=Hippoglossus hippoglossus TaxID=8267 RepID=UPI00148CFFE4|nr:C-C motif chemokine 19-like [Hippoglossus hippoglossus]XP_035021749.1 C-C motif chemokine 19 [Hippoglossus stenolepis]
MAPWGDSKLFSCFCILVITCYCTVTVAQIPMDCCLSVKNKMIERRRIVDYSLQTSGHGCSIDATILLTIRGRRLCVPTNEPWVQTVMSHVDRQKARCKGSCKSKRGAQGRRA